MRIPNPPFTVDQYLALERAAEERHEYLDARIVEKACESGEHSDITVNLVGSLGMQLKRKPCRVRCVATKVRTGPTPLSGQSTSGMFSYPDLLVVCGEPEYMDECRDVLLNPRVIIEVLSPSTEEFDRGAKRKRYQSWNPTLAHYLLVSQDRPQIEIYSRQPDGSWSKEVVSRLEDRVAIPAIECVLPLVDVYDRVSFAAG